MNTRLLVKKLVPDRVRLMYREVRKKVIGAEFKLFRLAPIKRNRVVFCNVWGFGDNPKWVALALLDENVRAKEESTCEPEIIFITDTSRKGQIPDGIRVLKNNSPAAVFALATARVWLDCNRKESYISKRTGQYYIQTWHGSIPLKKIEKDSVAEFTSEYRKNARRDTEMTDLYISNSEFCNDIYRRAFGYTGRVFVCGSPRVDVLLKSRGNDEAEQVLLKNRSNDEAELKVVYAPTFRGDGGRIRTGEDGQQVLEALKERFGRNVIPIKRLHPLSMTTAAKAEEKDGLDFKNAIDGNAVGDLYELLAKADVLITDYSNTMFEFALTGRPVFLYAPDYKEYADVRGMYFDYESLPFPIASNADELAEKILNYDEEEYHNKQKAFFDDLNITENGKASEKVARVILRVLERK